MNNLQNIEYCDLLYGWSFADKLRQVLTWTLGPFSLSLNLLTKNAN